VVVADALVALEKLAPGARGRAGCHGVHYKLRQPQRHTQPALNQWLTLTTSAAARYAEAFSRPDPLRITLNGELFELDEPLSVADLLAKLSIDARRVAVEHNLEILRRPLFADTFVHEGDRIEIVNFVGGG
jgi:sulfur carrier protein